MKKLMSSLLILLMMTTVAYSQKDKDKEKKQNEKDDEKIYNKLINLYTLDKFEDCIEASDRYIQNESTARSPYPYLYTSMSYLSIYNDRDSYEKIKDPLRKALSFYGKFKKKDKDGSLQKENGEYLRELKKTTLSECATLNEKKDYKNLQNLGRDIAKNYDKDEAMLIIGGVYLCKAQAKIEGEKSTETGMTLLQKRVNESNLKFEQEQADLIAQSIIFYSDYLVEIKDEAKAKSVMDLGKQVLPDNEKLNTHSAKTAK